MLRGARPSVIGLLAGAIASATDSTAQYQRSRTVRNRAAMVLRRRRRAQAAGPVTEAELDRLLDQYAGDTVFVHVGLSDINAAFEGNPFEFIMEKLDSRFESILT